MRREWMWIFKLTVLFFLRPGRSVWLSPRMRRARHMKLNHYTIYYLNFLALESLFWLLTERRPSRDGFYVISLMLEWGGSQWMPSFSIHRFITNNQNCSRFVIRKKIEKIPSKEGFGHIEKMLEQQEATSFFLYIPLIMLISDHIPLKLDGCVTHGPRHGPRT